MSTAPCLRHVAFEVDELQGALNRLAADGCGRVGGSGRYENEWTVTYVRGPEGIIVALAERIGWRRRRFLWFPAREWNPRSAGSLSGHRGAV